MDKDFLDALQYPYRFLNELKINGQDVEDDDEEDTDYNVDEDDGADAESRNQLTESEATI